jgi:hypothetical protein
MKRLTVFWLCLIGAFAFSAMIVVGAQAKKTEHGALVLESHGPNAHLGTSKGTISSSSNEGKGEFNNPTKGAASSRFNGVEFETIHAKCQSAGQEAGVVETLPLTEETGWIAKGTEAGVVFAPASGTNLAEFECGGIGVKVKGSVIGHTSPLNVDSADSKLDLFGTEGIAFHNEPERFDGEPSTVHKVLKSEFTGTTGELESLQEQRNVNVHNHGNSTVCKLKKGKEKCKPGQAETNGVVNPAQPEIGRCDKQKGGKFSEANCATLAEPGKGKFEFVPIPG